VGLRLLDFQKSHSLIQQLFR